MTTAHERYHGALDGTDVRRAEAQRYADWCAEKEREAVHEEIDGLPAEYWEDED